MIRRRTPTPATRVATWSVTSAMLRYPDATLLDALPQVRDAALQERIPHAEGIAALADSWLRRDLRELRAEYVDLFDLGRSTSLDMSWHQFGDRRQRGLVLLNLRATYAEHGFAPAGPELPDWLPLMLEFAASAPFAAAQELLETWRAPIELVRTELSEKHAPHVVMFDALSATLTPLGRDLKAHVQRLLEEGPPGEDVGLLPFGPNVEMEHGLMPSAPECSARRAS